MPIYFKDLKDKPFYEFFDELQSEVGTNAAAWLISPAKATEIANEFTTYQPLYDAIKVKNLRTKKQVDDHRAGRTVAEDYIEEFANEFIINNSNISKTTKEALGFNVPTDERSERPSINDVVFILLNALPGSRLEITCRTAADASRPSIHPDADAIEIRYFIGTNPPATVKDCTGTEISTKSKFVIQLDPADAGKKIYVYARWRNNIDVNKSGPFTNMQSTLVRE
jgi:hypothetical protein